MFNIFMEILGWFEEHVTGERRPEGSPKSGGSKGSGGGDRLTHEDLERDYATCEWCGGPNGPIDFGGGNEGWGCQSDHCPPAEDLDDTQKAGRVVSDTDGTSDEPGTEVEPYDGGDNLPAEDIVDGEIVDDEQSDEVEGDTWDDEPDLDQPTATSDSSPASRGGGGGGGGGSKGKKPKAPEQPQGGGCLFFLFQLNVFQGDGKKSSKPKGVANKPGYRGKARRARAMDRMLGGSRR